MSNPSIKKWNPEHQISFTIPTKLHQKLKQFAAYQPEFDQNSAIVAAIELLLGNPGIQLALQDCKANNSVTIPLALHHQLGGAIPVMKAVLNDACNTPESLSDASVEIDVLYTSLRDLLALCESIYRLNHQPPKDWMWELEESEFGRAGN